MRFVSRAGEKLQFAIDQFNINVKGKICADFGSNVGGFVDCLLENGARKVYAVETGYGVLAWKLRNDTRVVNLERTNAMHVKLPELVDLVTIDCSWTRQEKVIPNAIRNLKPGGEIITLIKPHYEADQNLLKKGRLPAEKAENVVNVTVAKAEALRLKLKGLIKSPILGGKGGNVEYLANLRHV